MGWKPKINKSLIPLKLHYFFFCGGLASIQPYLIIYLQQRGVSVTAIGLIYTILPFLAIIFKPAVGSLADRFQKHKLCTIACLIVTLVSFYAISFVPKNQTELTKQRIRTSCNSSDLQQSFCDAYVEQSIVSGNHSSRCTLSCEYCFENEQECEPLAEDTITNASAHSVLLHNDLHCCRKIMFTEQQPIECKYAKELYCTWSCDPEICTNDNETNEAADSISTKQMSYIVICMILSWGAQSTALSLTDTITLEILGDKKELFGKTHAFASLGYGLFSVLIGEILEIVNKGRDKMDVSPCFYAMATLLVLAIISIQSARNIKYKVSKNIVRDVVAAFNSVRSLMFAFSCFLIGALSGMNWTFLVVYLQELNISNHLFGFVYFSETVVGEFTFFLISRFLLRNLGYVHSISIVFAAYSIRFLGYSFVYNPLYVLPLEILEGFCFGLFFPALATFASRIANPNIAATTQGVLQGIFEGVGMGTGHLIGGLLYGAYGGRTMWKILSATAGIFCVLHIALHIAVNRLWPEQEERQQKVRCEEDINLDCLMDTIPNGMDDDTVSPATT